MNGTDDLPVDADGVVPVRVIVEEEPKESSAYLFVRTVPDPKSGGGVKEVQRRLQTCSARKRKESCATTTTPSKKRATTSTTYTRPSNNTRILRRVARRTLGHKLLHQLSWKPLHCCYVVTWTQLRAEGAIRTGVRTTNLL